MLAKVSIIGTLCLALVAAKPVDIAAEPTPTAAASTDSYDAFDLDPSNRAPVTAVPSIVPEEQARLQLTSMGTAKGGALDLPPAPTAAPNKAAAGGPANAEITVVNRHNGPITTVHVHGEGPGPKGNIGAGKLNAGQHGIFTVAHGWSGHVALNVAGK